MKRGYKLLSYILILVMVLSFVPITKEEIMIFAEEITTADEEILDSGSCGENLTYKLTMDGTLTISGTGKMTSNPWMKDRNEIKSIIIEDQVTTIKKRAFNHSENVKHAKIGASVTEIGEEAFSWCCAMETVDFPPNLKVIKGSAFFSCYSLKDFVLPDKLEIIEKQAFSNCCGLEKIVIPDSVTQIGYSVFGCCLKLTDVEMSKNITDFDSDVFSKTPYYDINLENGMLYCGNVLAYVDEECSENLEIKEGTRIIANRAYRGCDIKTITFPDSLIKIGNSAFYDCSQLTKLEFPKNLLEIGSAAFYNCKNLSKITFPDSLIEIERGAFYNTPLLTEVTIPRNVRKICEGTFCDEVLLNITILNNDMDIEMIGYPYKSTIHGYTNSTAQKYALENNITFVAIDGDEPPVVTPPQTTETETIPDKNVETPKETTTPEVAETSAETTTPEDVETPPLVTPSEEIPEPTKEPVTEESDMTTTKYTAVTTTEPIVTEYPTIIDMKQTTIAHINEKAIKPTIKKLKEKNWHTVKLTWKKISDVKKYTIYRSKKKSGKYKKIATTSKKSFLDKKVKSGTRYYYKIKVTSSRKEIHASKAKAIKVKGTPNKPKIKLNVNSRSWQIHWGIISDNSIGIEIYMKNGEGKFKKFTRINRTVNIKKSKKKKGATGIQSSIDSLAKGITYQFKARTYAKVKGKKVYSKWSKTVNYTKK